MTTLAELPAYFTQCLDEMLARIQAWVAHETPSDDKTQLDAFARRLAAAWQEAGARTQLIPVDKQGDHVWARFSDPAYVAEPKAPPALILCHYDTVWPVGTLAVRPFRVEGGRAYGPGIFDMKTSLVLAEFFLRGVRDLDLRLPRPVLFLATSDEEVGSPSSRALIENTAREAAYVLVLESPLPGGVLKTARKGSAGFVMEILGRAAHAGVEPEKGVSAVLELGYQILRLHGLNDREQGTTVNVGVVHGGTRPNVVPAYARAEIDVRAWTAAELERVTQAICQPEPTVPGAQIRVKTLKDRPPMERRMCQDLFRQAQAIGREMGMELEEGATGGGSDGNLTAAVGTRTLDGLGVPGDGAHADHEHILVDQIAPRAALLTGLVLGLT